MVQIQLTYDTACDGLLENSNKRSGTTKGIEFSLLGERLSAFQDEFYYVVVDIDFTLPGFVMRLYALYS